MPNGREKAAVLTDEMQHTCFLLLSMGEQIAAWIPNLLHASG